MSEEEKKVEEKTKSIWRDFKDDPPTKFSIIIVLTKHGMHFYHYNGSIDDPLNTMCGLFWVRSDQNCSGLRYSIEISDLLYWMPLPEAYVS